jgi:hypothetical protein
MEIWKTIKGYEGVYEVSNYGRIKSLERNVNNKFNTISKLKEKFLKPNIANQYLGVILSNKGEKKYISVHKLVALNFIKEFKFPFVVNHKDFNKLNNNLTNLEVVTSRENTNKKHIKSSSIYTGVSWDKSKNKFVSQINIKGKIYKIGTFKNEIDAHFAYQNKLNKIQYGIKTSN